MSMDVGRFSGLIAIVVLIAFGTGCVNQRTTPGYGRAGDYISIGLAGVKFNTDQNKTLRASDLTALYYDVANDTYYDLRVLNTFRAFPDHTSQYAVLALDRTGNFGEENSDIEPYDGQWWVTLKLDNPVTGNPITAPPGLGFIRISVVNPGDIVDVYESDGNLANGHLFELIAGTPNLDPAATAQFDSYRSRPSLTLQPDAAYGVTSVGGFQIKLDYNTASLREVNSVKSPIVPRLVPISHDPNINIIQHTVDNGSGNRSLIAMVTNPNGFIATSAQGVWVPGNSIFEDLNMAVVVDDATQFASWSSDYVLDPVESYYIDINGIELTGVEPTLGFSN